MSFVVFLLVLLFGTFFVGVSIQARRLATAGHDSLSLVPTFLALKMSDKAYQWTCGGIGWAFVVLGGVIYNLKPKDPGDPNFSGLYFFVLTGLHVFFWLRNRAVELKP